MKMGTDNTIKPKIDSIMNERKIFDETKAGVKGPVKKKRYERKSQLVRPPRKKIIATVGEIKFTMQQQTTHAMKNITTIECKPKREYILIKSLRNKE
jgi:hypothetical protein